MTVALADTRAPQQRAAQPDWAAVERGLDEVGFARLPGLLPPAEARAVAAMYGEDARFRSRVVMQRHGYGQGEYRYFAYPLPEPIATLRTSLFPPLARIANRWNGQMGLAQRFPEEHAAFVGSCAAAGQVRPTPLLLRYEPGDYNCLHQDLYGDMVFPLQVAILLSQPHEEFEGGEFVLTEQRPRRQSRASVVPLEQGDAVVFAVRERPVHGTRGYYRVQQRHGVSTLRAGRRFTLGIIFHDAR